MRICCPNCLTLYDIDKKALDHAEGMANCYRCHQVFNAFENKLEESQAERTELTAAPSPASAPATSDSAAQETSTTAEHGTTVEPEESPPAPESEAATRSGDGSDVYAGPSQQMDIEELISLAYEESDLANITPDTESLPLAEDAPAEDLNELIPTEPATPDDALAEDLDALAPTESPAADDTLPEDISELIPTEPPTLDDALAEDLDELIPTEPAALDDALPEDVAELLPAEPTVPKSGSTPGRKLLLGFGIIALGLGATAQLTWLHWDRVSIHPEGQKVIEKVCDWLPCKLPPRRSPDRFVILQRDLKPVLDPPGALALQILLSNGADFPQPPPVVELTFLEYDDTVLGRRRFQPDEYLYPASGAGTLITPKESINIEMLLLDPGPQAAGFRLEFL